MDRHVCDALSPPYLAPARRDSRGRVVRSCSASALRRSRLACRRFCDCSRAGTSFRMLGMAHPENRRDAPNAATLASPERLAVWYKVFFVDSRLQQGDSWSGGCGQAETQMCCHMVNVLNANLPAPTAALLTASQTQSKTMWCSTPCRGGRGRGWQMRCGRTAASLTPSWPRRCSGFRVQGSGFRVQGSGFPGAFFFIILDKVLAGPSA